VNGGSGADDTFKIGDFGTTTTQLGVPVDLVVPVQIVDGDGDTANSSITAVLLPEGAGGFADYSLAATGQTWVANATTPNVLGSRYADSLTGDSGLNIIYGNDGNDVINGGSGNDTVSGGNGGDTLSGGLGADTFNYVAFAESQPGVGLSDRITDFQEHSTGGFDLIDLATIDANASGGTANDTFAFVSTQTTNVVANSVTWSQAGVDTTIRADVDGNLTNGAELTIELTGLHNLQQSDFHL
jgi:Ca2+-binding RTX toxin-like protein